MTDGHKRVERFAVGDEPRVEIRLMSGSVLVTPGEPGVVVVEAAGPDPDRLRIEHRGATVLVESDAASLSRWQSYGVTLRVPEDTRLHAWLASADLAADGPLGGVNIDAASGDVRIADVAGAVQVKTASGRFRAHALGGPLQFTTASGSADVGAVEGPARLHAASGDLRLGRARGAVTAKSASGVVHVGLFEGPVLSCKTMSGDVEIGMPPDRTLDVDLRTLSGLIRNEFEIGGSGTGPSTGRASVQVRTLSGDVALVRSARQD